MKGFGEGFCASSWKGARFTHAKREAERPLEALAVRSWTAGQGGLGPIERPLWAFALCALLNALVACQPWERCSWDAFAVPASRAIVPSIKCNASSKDVLRYTNVISLQNDSSGFMIYYDNKTANHYKMSSQLGCQISWWTKNHLQNALQWWQKNHACFAFCSRKCPQMSSIKWPLWGHQKCILYSANAKHFEQDWLRGIIYSYSSRVTILHFKTKYNTYIYISTYDILHVRVIILHFKT